MRKFNHLLFQIYTLKNKFINDVAWNIVSTCVLGTSGIIINVLIGNHYHADGLGLYSQALAFYMITSVVTIFGVNSSLIKHVAEYKEQQNVLNELITAAIILVFILSCILSFFLYSILSYCYDRIEIISIINNMIIAIPVFSINKALLGVLSGLRRMKAFAFTQSMRWILIICFFVVSIFLKKPLHQAVNCFFFVETILFLWLGWYSKKFYRYSFHNFPKWIRVHAAYGGKTFLTHSVNELVRYTDIFMIRYFLTDGAVGIYSFASSIAKGVFSISGVIQLNFSPIVSHLWSDKNIKKLKDYISKINKGSLLLMTPTVIIAGMVFPILTLSLMKSQSYSEGIPVFYILLTGIWIKSVFSYLGIIFPMTGRPGFNTKIVIIVLIFNVIFNAIFIPLLGIQGAAIASSASDILLIFLLGYFIRKKLNINIW